MVEREAGEGHVGGEDAELGGAACFEGQAGFAFGAGGDADGLVGVVDGPAGGEVPFDAEGLLFVGVIHEAELEGLAGGGVGVDAGPAFVDGVVGVGQGSEFGQELGAPAEFEAHAVDAGGVVAEHGQDVLVDEPGVAAELFKKTEAVEIAFVLAGEVAVLQAVIVGAGGGERVADEEDLFAGFAFNVQAAVVEGLAGEEVAGHAELAPLPGVGLAFDFAGDGVGGEAGHAVAAGVFDDVLDLIAIEHFGAEAFGDFAGVVGVVVVVVGDPEAFEGFEAAGGLEFFEFFDDLGVAGVEEEGGAGGGDEEAGVADGDDPVGQVALFGHGHGGGGGAAHGEFGAGLPAFFAPVPAEGVGGEVAVEETFETGDEQGDLFLRVFDGGAAGGEEAVRLLGGDGTKAGDELSGAGGEAVVAAGFGFGDLVLEAVEIEEAAAGVDEVAGGDDAFAVLFEQVRDGGGGVAGGIEDGDFGGAEGEDVAAADGAGDGAGFDGDFGGFLGVVVEAELGEEAPEFGGIFKSGGFAGGDNEGPAGGEEVAAGGGEQDVLGRAGVDGDAAGEEDGVQGEGGEEDHASFQGLRYLRVTILLAWGSPTICSFVSSQVMRRPVR